MHFLRRLIHQEQPDAPSPVLALVALVLLLLIDIALILSSTNRIQGLSMKPQAVSGVLESVDYVGSSDSLKLHVGSDVYVLKKEGRYTKRTFGVVGNPKLFPLWESLCMEVGNEVVLEYVPVAGQQRIVQLSIDGVEYVDKDIAIDDFIEYENTMRTIGSVAGFAFAILFILIWKAIHR